VLSKVRLGLEEQQKKAKKYVARMRRRGYNVSVVKRKKGYGVSVTRR